MLLTIVNTIINFLIVSKSAVLSFFGSNANIVVFLILFMSFLIFFASAIRNTFALRSEEKVTEKLHKIKWWFFDEWKTKIT